MQVSSYHAATFAPIKAARVQPYTLKQSNPKPIVEATQHTQNTQSKILSGNRLWENKSFSFWDILDAINPLQHIPVISTIYRKITGDEMGYASRIAGDTLYGGLFGSLISGFVAAVANVFVDSTTGKDIGEHMIASITPSATSQNNTTPIAVSRPITQAAQHKPAVRHSTMPPAVLFVTPTSAIAKKSPLSDIDPASIKTGMDQYKWQIMADEVKQRSNRWV